MESTSERERILLGYSPLDSFGGATARSHRRNPDVDFLDVFGGPPRRSSVYESRRSRADSIDSCYGSSLAREDSVGSRLSRLGSGEKPVFGDVSGSNRRQQLGDDFFGDIFQISESSCSSPRRANSDPLMSSPSSRVSSPNRPTLPRWEPLSGGSSFPTPSSLSEAMDKGSSHPVFGSSSPNASSTGPFATQSVEGHTDLRNNGHGFYHQTPVSCQIPHGLQGFPESEVIEPVLKSQTWKSSSSLEDYINNQQFHFSIYKWAGKGVMLVMPSDSDERNEFEGRLASLPEVIVQELELPTHCDYLSSVTKPLKSGTVIEKDKSDKRDVDNADITAKISHVVSGLEFLKGDTNQPSEKNGNKSEKTSIPGFEEKSTTNSTDGEQSPEFRFNLHSEQNLELKNISQMLDDDTGEQRSHDISTKVKERQARSRSQKKQQLLRESKLVPGEVNSITFNDILSFSEDKPLVNKVKGKVKEFIKKFNHETLPKRKSAFEILNRRSKGDGSKHDKAEELVQISSNEADNMQGGSKNKSILLFDIPKIMENRVIEKAEEEKSSIFDEVHIINDLPSEERLEVLHQQSEYTPEDLKNVEFYEEIIQEGFEEYLVQQLPVYHTEEAQNMSEEDQIKISDANIRQWSKGKEGNIRSLLSTLQLVLWPDSGWKQVPLVNIIEAPSVKKAYQKALLCLHPDKLQQKGASSNQKYIAEKVFDILQEAWDHFNSVSQL